MPGRRKTSGAGANHGHTLRATFPSLDLYFTVVTDIAFKGANVHRAIKFRPIALEHAKTRADPATHGRQR